MLIALHEGDIAFEPRLVSLGEPADRAAFQSVWPLTTFPVLLDNARRKTMAESSIIVDYLARAEPCAASLVPGDRELTMQTRLIDRLIDNCIHAPFEQFVAERVAPRRSA